MRIMDCVLLLFRRAISPVVFDPERECVTPSWGESLKVLDLFLSLYYKASSSSVDVV